jgi:hypothetical protein
LIAPAFTRAITRIIGSSKIKAESQAFVVAIEKGELLQAVHAVVGGIHIDGDATGATMQTLAMSFKARTETDRKITNESWSSRQSSTEPIRPLFGVNGVVCPKKEKREQKYKKTS